MRKTIWVGLICCLAFFLFYTTERGAAKDISSDVDMSTKIGCGVTEPQNSPMGNTDSNGDTESTEKERDSGEEGSGLRFSGAYEALMWIWIGKILYFGEVIRLAMI